MFKKITIIATITLMTGGLIWGAIHRTQAKTYNNQQEQRSHGQNILSAEEATDYTAGQGNRYGSLTNSGGQGRMNGELGTHNGLGYVSGDYSLTDAEKAALIYMVEEEKLAGDVYLRLYELWNLPVFQNIQQSELQHQQSVANLLEQYGIENPSSEYAGVFANPDLQALYQQLVAIGSQSLAEALRVGALIEEMDISDLQQRLAQTSNPEVEQVFTNLMNGSIHHLSSFTALYNREAGLTYQPQFLSTEQMAQLLETAGNGQNGNPNGNSRGYRGGRN
jgi:hypothetical protein